MSSKKLISIQIISDIVGYNYFLLIIFKNYIFFFYSNALGVLLDLQD